MRPNIDNKSKKVYECFSCGARTADPSDGCPNCGNELMNLSHGRDL